MANYQVRGCCCGVPFGCGTVIVVLLGFLLWKLAGIPDLLASLPPLSSFAALWVAVPGVVIALAAGRGARRR